MSLGASLPTASPKLSKSNHSVIRPQSESGALESTHFVPSTVPGHRLKRRVHFPVKTEDAMSSALGFQSLETTLVTCPPSEDVLRRQVWGVLTSTYPQGRIVERRMDPRYPYPHLLYLTPAAEDGR